MGKYFYLQLKRMCKMLPLVVVITAVLFGATVITFFSMMQLHNDSENVKKFHIGITGETDGKYFDLGLSALKTLDNTRFSIEMDMIDNEEEAQRALRSNDISAYFVFPEGFIQSAMQGEIRSIRMVTDRGAGGLIPMFKEEIASAVSTLLIESQRGVFGVESALDDNGYQNLSYEYLNKMNVEYINFVLNRTEIFSVQELGIADTLTLPEYFFCSFAVLLLLLMGLPYALILVRKDRSMEKILSSRNMCATKQIVCELGAYTLCLLLLAVAITLPAGVVAGQEAIAERFGIDGFSVNLSSLLMCLFPVVLCTAVFQMFLFELSENIVNGVLLHFFCTISLCYITGFFYPIYTFPKIVQQAALFFPTGLMRSCLASCITQQSAMASFCGLLIYFVIFLGLLITMRHHKLTAKAG